MAIDQSAGDYSVNPNEAAKTAVVAALGEIPEGGVLIATLTDIFWPESDPGNGVWDQIEQKVEALIQRDLSDAVQRDVHDDLDGLKDVLSDYTKYAQDKKTTGAEIARKYDFAQGSFLQRLPHFRSSGYEVLLLPLWAQAANMHLGLLRDGVRYGESWGWSPGDRAEAATELRDKISDYTAWAPRIFGLGMANALAQTTPDYRNCQPFRAGNEYRTHMIPVVLDLAARWPYYDPDAYPFPVPADKLYLSREIYTDPVGTADDRGLFLLPWHPPTWPISQITVWDEPNLIDAIQVSYPQSGGPDQVSQTRRMGSPSTGNRHDIPITPGNPVTRVSVWAGDVVQGLSLTFKDGSSSPHFGGTGGTRADFSLYDQDDEGNKTWQILSSIYVNGMSNYYKCADAIVFGFQYERPKP